MSTKKNKFKKLFSVIILLFLIGLLLYLTFSLENRSVLVVKNIEIKGAEHLTKELYFKYANFDHYNDYKYLNLTTIKDRIIKHPYVKDADVEFVGNDKVVIELVEKKIEALYYTDKSQYLITDDWEIIPQLPFTRELDYPIITNPVDEGFYKPFQYLKKTDDIKTALKIITTFQYLNDDLLVNLSEINLNNGEEIILDISTFDYPVYVGRDNLIKKIIYFDKFYNSIKENLYSSAIGYLDSRFEKNIYMQLNVPESKTEEEKL
ncbi:MAG: FtsQ-type POTRA domain-containing protein [bacterium]